jgi:hypothetical protein
MRAITMMRTAPPTLTIVSNGRPNILSQMYATGSHITYSNYYRRRPGKSAETRDLDYEDVSIRFTVSVHTERFGVFCLNG